ncbi:RelA/SpoT domain-containing protein [Methylocaldum gracile]|jgi:hypothetical protein|uniref:RelA/SpoT domain-containing protein n=1 Tax=Methylocaldum sp. 0917 TaxID=2485163 RepID=UPI0010619CFF
MVWPTPKYSRNQVNKAGSILIDEHSDLEDWVWAYQVLSNWRGCHGYPINTFQATLRQKLKKIDPDAIVAQRLKRTPSIFNKLRRIPGMNLARMQDIGGLRAVVNTIQQVKTLHSNYKSTKFTHTLVSEYDYIGTPKSSGYRSIHLVYRYKLQKPSPYDGLQLELQLRTRLQHAWATAVETVGTFLEQSLKSSEGPEEWLRFFSLTGSGFAYIEKAPLVPGYEHLSKRETFGEIAERSKLLGVRDILVGYRSAVQSTIGTSRAAYYLVELNLTPDQKKVSVTPFSRDQLEQASQAYSEAEQRAADGAPIQVVLVSAGSVESLRRAYPNYFLDTHDFLEHLSQIERSARSSVSRAG